MAKIKIDLDPKGPITYDREVAIPTPSGKPLKMTFTFKNRNREEMAELREKYIAKARDNYVQATAEVEKEKSRREEDEKSGRTYMPPDPKLVEGVPEAIANDVAAVLDVACGWNLDYEFNAENVGKFLALYAAAPKAIGDDYFVSMTEGRLGN